MAKPAVRGQGMYLSHHQATYVTWYHFITGSEEAGPPLSPTPGLPGGKATSRAWCSGPSRTCKLVDLLAHRWGFLARSVWSGL